MMVRNELCSEEINKEDFYFFPIKMDAIWKPSTKLIY
jgi:hypothetical protein